MKARALQNAGDCVTRTLSRALILSLLTLIATLVVLPPSSASQKLRLHLNADAGRRIYREGILPSGKPVRAVVQNDIALEGTQLPCANCHRRSGLGSSEGAAYVPPITSSFLFGSRELRRTDLFRKLFQEIQPHRFRARVRSSRLRPSYTEATFAAALREGKDPLGRDLDPLMPRYILSDEDVKHLAAYLKSLDAGPAPGVTGTTIHFATIVTAGVAPEKQRAMLEVMAAYFRLKNAETQGLLARPGHAAFYDADSYSTLREWRLHVWELKGPDKTWPSQLASYYRQQPVFALLSGVGEGSWQAVHDFCERQEVPCLFPQINQPVVSTIGAYSLYFSGGLSIDAEVLARHLRQTVITRESTRLLQVYRDAEDGHVLANALRRALQKEAGLELRDHVIHASSDLSPTSWNKLLEDERPSALVLWIDDDDLAALTTAQASADRVQQIYLSYSLLDKESSRLPVSFRDKTFFTYPFNLPQAQTPHAYRARAWLRARRVVSAYERTQFNTYFALAVADHSLTNLAANFSRDYFIENVEHETEGTPNPGVYPRLSLGPGQRFASKGGYIVKVCADRLEAASAWIIP